MRFLSPYRWRLLAAGLLLVGVASLPAAGKDDWLPITPEELALKDNPASPGSAAMILYREASFDDSDRFSTYYYRIKVFTEVGRERYADVQILYREDLEYVDSIKARTIRPDGTVVEFAGPVYDKVLYKKRRTKYLVKAFSFPEAEVGSILEYKFTLRWPDYVFLVPRWTIQEQLYTRRARFHFRPYLAGSYHLSHSRSSARTYVKAPRVLWTSYLPGGQAPQVDEYNNVSLELANIPGFPEEDFMPPADQLKWRVEFFYIYADIQSVDDFWQREGKEWNEIVEKFIGKSKGVEREASSLVSGGDSAEARLKRLYARAQQVRNLTFARGKTEEEAKREKLKENKSAQDVLVNGYGTRSEVNRLFVALARAAGFPAAVARVSERDEFIFQKNLLDWEQLSGEVAVVAVEGKELYFDPGTPLCPFGLLAWEKSGVAGLRLDENGGVFIKTPVPEPGQAQVERQAELSLDAEGALTGTLRLAFHGRQALKRRGEASEEDEVARRQKLEDEVKGWLPPAAELELKQMSGWENAEEPLRAEFRLRLAGFASSTGRRWLVPASLFPAQWQERFQQTQRAQPIQLEFPFEHTDEIVIHLPAGAQVESLPKPQNRDSSLGRYELTLENAGDTLRVRRRLQVKGFAYSREFYSLLRGFFNAVRAGDGEQAVLQTVEVGQRE